MMRLPAARSALVALDLLIPRTSARPEAGAPRSPRAAALVTAREHDHLVAPFLDLRRHQAGPPAQANDLHVVLARSSRGTGPKMRVRPAPSAG